MSASVQRKALGPVRSDFNDILEEAMNLGKDRDPEAQALLKENVRLQCIYPEQYVAYIDSWSVLGNVRSLCRRVVSHSPRLKEIHAALAQLSPADRSEA